MIIEKFELTMSQLGLGALTEYALMVMFGNAHSHCLTLGRDNNPSQIVDAHGLTLYPAYFMTHLTVPASRPLASFALWDRVAVGVDVQRFGDTLLESSYALGREDELAESAESWDPASTPMMRGANLIVVDVAEESASRRVSAPKPDCIADLPKVKKPPHGLLNARKVRANGFGAIPNPRLAAEAPFLYDVALNRDAAPNHAMIFAKFVEVMDYAETALLTRSLQPGFQLELLGHLHVLEREIYYYGNAFAGETLAIHVKGDARPCAADHHGESMAWVSTALFDFEIGVYRARNNALLALARVRKLLALPTRLQDAASDVARALAEMD